MNSKNLSNIALATIIAASILVVVVVAENNVPTPPEQPHSSIIPIGHNLCDMIADPARPYLYVSDSTDNAVLVVNTETDTIEKSIWVGSKPTDMSINSDNSTLYVVLSGAPGSIAVVDLENQTKADMTIHTSYEPRSIEAMKPGRLHLLRHYHYVSLHQLLILDMENNTEVDTDITAFDIEITRDGNILYLCDGVSSTAADIKKYNITTDTPVLVKERFLGTSSGKKVKLSPDESRVYMQSWDEVPIFSTSGLDQVGTLDPESGGVVDVALCPGGAVAYVATSYEEQYEYENRESNIYVFNTSTFARERLWSASGHIKYDDYGYKGSILETSSDGGKLYVFVGSGSEYDIDVFDLTMEGEPFPEVSISPDYQSGRSGEILEYTVTITNKCDIDSDYNLSIETNTGWDPILGDTSLEIPAGESCTTALSVTIPRHGEPGTECAIMVVVTSQTDSRIIGKDNCIAHIQPHSSIIPIGHNLWDMIADPARPYLYVSDSTDNAVLVVNTETDTIEKSIWVGSKPTDMSINSDNSTLYVVLSGAPGSIAVVDLENQTKADMTIHTSYEPRSIEAMKPGRLHLLRQYDNYVSWRKLLIVNVENGTELDTDITAYDIEITGDGNTLYLCDSGSNADIKKYDITTDTPALVKEASSGTSSGEKIKLSPDESRIYLQSWGEVPIFSTSSLDQVGTLDPESRGVADVALCPGGAVAYIATSYEEQYEYENRESNIYVFNTSTFARERLWSASGHIKYDDYGYKGSILETSSDGGKLYVFVGSGYDYDIEVFGASTKGDLNFDGVLTSADAAIALELAARGDWDPAADVDCDWRVTSVDALMILQAAASAP